MAREKNLTIERRAYSVDEIATALGVSAGFIRLEIARKNLSTVRAGRRVLILKDAFERYLRRGAEGEQ